MSVEPGERRTLGVATGAGGVVACAACCAPPVIGLLGIGTGVMAVLSAALFAGLLVAVVVGAALVGTRLLLLRRVAN